MRRLVPPLFVLLALLACASGASAAARLYAPSYGSGPPETVSAFDVAATGSLSPLAGSPFPLYVEPSGLAGVTGIAFTPDGTRAASSYLFDGGVQGLSLNAAGGLAPAGAATLTASSTGIAVSPDGRFAYAPTREFGSPAEGIRVFSIAADGTLVPAGSFGSAESYEVAIGGGGRFLFTIGTTGIERFAISADGGLTPLGATPVLGARFLVTSPDGRFLFVARQGGGGGLVSLTVGADGSLTANGDAFSTPGENSKIPTVAAAGNRVYLPDDNDDTVFTLAVAADGKLSLLSKMAVDDPRVLAATPDGRFLYLYHGGPAEGLAVAALDPSGVPSLLPFLTPFENGEPIPMVFRPGPAPVASFTGKAAAPGAAASFNAAKSTNAAVYDWDFGDGTKLANGGPKPTHVYAKAGKYTATLSVTDGQGCGAKQVYTGQSTTCPGGGATTTTVVVDTLPVISKLKVAPKRFRPKGVSARTRGKTGAIIRYKVNELSKVRLKIDRKLPGRKVGGKCRKVTKANRGRKKCKRFKKVGPVKGTGKVGLNKVTFNGKRGGEPLAPGGYRITAVATDSAQGRSAARTASFRVLPY